MPGSSSSVSEPITLALPPSARPSTRRQPARAASARRRSLDARPAAQSPDGAADARGVQLLRADGRCRCSMSWPIAAISASPRSTAPPCCRCCSGSAFLARQFWGWLSDRIGGFQTLLCSSLVQATALTGFLLTQDQAAAVRRLRRFRPRPVGPAAGLCDRDPRLLFGRGGELAHPDRDVRRPARHGGRRLGRRPALRSLRRLLPAFATGIGFNLVEPRRAAVPRAAAARRQLANSCGSRLCSHALLDRAHPGRSVDRRAPRMRAVQKAGLTPG